MVVAAGGVGIDCCVVTSVFFNYLYFLILPVHVGIQRFVNDNCALSVQPMSLGAGTSLA